MSDTASQHSASSQGSPVGVQSPRLPSGSIYSAPLSPDIRKPVRPQRQAARQAQAAIAEELHRAEGASSSDEDDSEASGVGDQRPSSPSQSDGEGAEDEIASLPSENDQ